MGQKQQQQNNTTSTAIQHRLEKDYGSKVEHSLQTHSKHLKNIKITKMIPLQTQVVHLKDDSIT